MSTQYGLKYDPSHDPDKKWRAAVAAVLATVAEGGTTPLTLEGADDPQIYYAVDDDGGFWFAGSKAIRTDVPDNLARFLRANRCWTIDIVVLVKGAAAEPPALGVRVI
jgi:hypothetical protein